MHTLIVSLIGPDKAGLVTQLAALIQQHKGSWQASAMTELEGYFAGILEIQVPGAHDAPLRHALAQLPDVQVQLFEASTQAPTGQAVQLTVTANDRLGIMAELTEILSQLNIRIKALKTATYPAPTTSIMIFEARSILTLPPGQTRHDLQQRLQALSDDLIVDLDLIATL